MKLTRKKSVESKISSAPATPAKTVHFNDGLEQVQHFLQIDRTISISADLSPTNRVNEQKDTLLRSNGSSSQSTQWKVTATKFPRASNRDQQLFHFESLYLSADCGRLIGAVTVANIAFEKQVAARFTIDDWQTVSKVTTEYKWTPKPADAYDQFRFAITLPARADLHTTAAIFCIRYRVNG